MTSQPDKLFRDKLENFQQPAPTGAWDRIESNLVRPAHKLVWVRVAAGVALLAAAAIVLWPSEKPETEIAKTTEHTPAKKDTAQQQTDKKTETKDEAVKQQAEPVLPPQETNTVTLAKTEKQSPVQQTANAADDSVLTNSVSETHVLIAEVPLQEKELTSKTIVYTADEVNSKFLKKKLPPQATPDSKEASGIQKLIGLAYDAKNSEAPLGDLRQKKDDILALNFGKKKGEN